MSKRAVLAFALLSLSLGLMITRIATLEIGEYAGAAAVNGKKSIDIAYSRGYIYDCRMQPLVNRKQTDCVAAKPTARAMTFFRDCISDEEFTSVSESFKRGRPVFVNLTDTQIVPDSSDFFVFKKIERYGTEPFLSHVIGYLAPSGVSGISGIEAAFENELSAASGKLSVSYSTNAFGAMLAGEPAIINDLNYNSGAGVVLTIDERIQSILENSMREGGIDKGAGVILDAATGEIRAMASMPDFPSGDISSAVADEENSPLINRALSAYSVGSVFKTVVAAAALENSIGAEKTYCCTGSVSKNGVEFHCNKRDGHGDVDMKNALAVSCNTYFINLACELGAEKILAVAAEMGFGREIELCPGMVCAGGVLPSADELDSEAALSNLGFGQGRLLASPLQMAAAYLSIANGGKYLTPSLVKGVADADGKLSVGIQTQAFKRVMSESCADELCGLLGYVVEHGSFSASRPMNVSSAGKTATAQSGWYIEGKEVLHSWFAGFFPADNPVYVVVIMKENGRSGGTDCVPVFKSISTEIVNNLFVPD